MSPHVERGHASWLLRLLLDPGAPGEAAGKIDWDVLLDVAQLNGVLVRTAERLATLGVSLPSRFADAAARERDRVRSALDLIRHVSRSCEAAGLEFVFPKVFQDYPDIGDDVDLLLRERSARLDRLILAGLAASAAGRDVGGWIAGTTTYVVDDCPTPLDVQHGRLGVVGEHAAFPLVLLQRRRRLELAGFECLVPPPEDQLVLQGLQRVWGRLHIALCDVVFTISAIRRGTLDWDYVIRTAREHGALPGLSCYLSYVDQVYRDVFWQPLVVGPVRQALVSPRWGQVRFHRAGYAFPLLRVNGRLYREQWGARLAAGDWSGAGRLCLIPLVAAVRALRRATRTRAPAAQSSTRAVLTNALGTR